MSDNSNALLLHKYGNAWVITQMNHMESQLKELRVQMQMLQAHLDKLQRDVHSTQLLIHRHLCSYSSRRVNKIVSLVRDLHSLDE